MNHKSIDVVKKSQIGAGAAVKIERASYQSAKSYGRQ
jgi:translation initiation factor 5B